jgi:hypothetical protein
LERKVERVEEAEDGIGRNEPEMTTVMFGWVKENGCVCAETTGNEVDKLEREIGTETVNGRFGEVKLNVRGAGSIIVARAFNETEFAEDEMLNDWRVTS